MSLTGTADYQGFFTESRLILGYARSVWGLIPRGPRMALIVAAAIMAIGSALGIAIPLLLGRLVDLSKSTTSETGPTDAFLAAFPDSAEFGERRARAEGGLAELVRRAKEAGRLRADFAQADLVLLLLANGGVVTDTRETTEAASRRLVAYLLRSFESTAGAGSLPPAPPIGLGQLYRLPGD